MYLNSTLKTNALGNLDIQYAPCNTEPCDFSVLIWIWVFGISSKQKTELQVAQNSMLYFFTKNKMYNLESAW